MLENHEGSPLSVFFRHGELFFPKIKIFPHFNFLMFCDRMDVGNPKGSPFQFFGIVRLFFQKFVFSPKGPPFNCDKNVANFGSPPFSAPGARASGPRRATRSIFCAFSIFEYWKLTLGSPFAIFEPWIWRRLGPVPACLTCDCFFFLQLIWKYFRKVKWKI